MTTRLLSLLGALAIVLLLLPLDASAHPSRPNPARWTACAELELGDSCQYEDEHHIYRGTCRQLSDRLACVRNQPIEHR